MQLASAQAQAGDAVLISPACASMDMFRDYAHRAQAFIEAVQALAETAGQVLEGAAMAMQKTASRAVRCALGAALWRHA